MMNQEKLLQDLFSLRETIKNQAKLKGEKSPMVCSDHAIHEMARLCPRKIEDFHSVAGLGKLSFIFGKASGQKRNCFIFL